MVYRSLLWGGVLGCVCLLLGALVVGCATQEHVIVRYDDDGNRSRYVSQSVDLVRSVDPLRSSSVQVIAMRATAECTGQDCEPDTVRLRLNNTGRNAIWLNYQTVEIKAGTEEFRWDNLTFREIERVRNGEFAHLDMNRDAFLRMLRAREIEGVIGTTPFHLTSDDLQPLYEFAVALSRDIDEVDQLFDSPAAAHLGS